MALGTRNVLRLPGLDPHGVLAGSERLVHHYEALLTVNRTHSDVMAINDAAGRHAVIVSPLTFRVIQEGLAVSLTYPGFDLAIGPLVQLWRIGFKDAQLPSEAAITSRLAMIDPTKIELDDRSHSVFLRQPGMSLDLGGIGKGYIADAIREFWRRNGVFNGLIDLGGNLVAVGPGPHADRQWRVGIQDPQRPRGTLLGMLKTPAAAIGTTGIYERYLEIDGHRYHHILDPRTGWPLVTKMASVTAVTDRSIDGEIFSSLGFFYGAQHLTALLAAHPHVGLITTWQDGTVSVTPNLVNQFELTSAAYRWRKARQVEM